MPTSNPAYNGSVGASWLNTPFLEEDANVAFLGPRPLNMDLYIISGGYWGTAAHPEPPGYDKAAVHAAALAKMGELTTPSIAGAVSNALNPNLPLPADHKKVLYIVLAIVAVIVVPKLLKKARK
jgi:hypothetical protein